jgi:DnaD/phage-associated family protein
MKELGMQNAPTGTELQFFDRWQGEYGFSLTIITEACRRTVLQTQTKRLQYCDGILRNCYEKGAHTLEDIKQLDADFGKTMPKSSASHGEPAKFATKFNRFKQNDYNLDAMENQLLDN